MSEMPGALGIGTAPFLQSGLNTRRLMYEVLAALVPVVAAACWFFGVVALLLVAAGTAGAVLAEWGLGSRRGPATLRDGSAVLTGVLFALTLPPAIPLWMAFLGGVVGVALGKAMWGGLGQNLFNPALVGRAFLQAAFPVPMTTWSEPGAAFFSLPATTLAPPFGRAVVDATTTATPLALAKFDHQVTAAGALFSGHIAGSLGETSAAVLLLCGLWLGLRRAFDWRLPAATLITVALAAAAVRLVAPAACAGAPFMLLSGGLLFGAVFMVTDPVTTPITPRGAWIFGLGVGVLVVLIRVWGGLPEGVMYSILLMNAVTPLINRWTQPRQFGARSTRAVG